jgi:predicted small lipoprotein YifL
MNEMKMHARIGLSMIAACALLVACGQRGALYLPEESRNVTITPMPPEQPVELQPTPATAPAIPPGTRSAEAADAEEARRRNTQPPPAN